MLVAIAALAVPTTAQALYIDSYEREQVKLINQYRADHGLKRLRMDVKLTRAGDWMGRDMARNNYFAHEDSLGRDPFQRLDHYKYPDDTWRGENLAAGNEDAQATFDQWLNSPPHRENMLNANYRAIGITRVAQPDNSQYGYYWVTEFGSRVVLNMPSKRVQDRLRKYTSPRKRAIRIRARVCEKFKNRGITYRRLKCGWHIKTARQLRVLGM